MWFKYNLKKIIITIVLLLVSGDISLLLATQTDFDDPGDAASAATTPLQTTPTNTTVPPSQLQVATPPPSTSAVGAAQPVAPAAQSTPAASSASSTTAPTTAPAASTAPATSTSAAAAPAFSAPQPVSPVAVTQQPATATPNAPDQTLAPPATNVANNPAGGVTQDQIKENAFNAMTQNMLPMSPEQIQRLRSLFDQAQYAAAATPGTPPRPTATSQFVNLSPGSTPPVVRLAQGFITSLVFVDSTGAPWPIAAYDVGNPSAFNIQWDHKDNTLMIQSTTLYTYGNLAVRLQGLATPVMITLIPGQQAVDYRVDLRVPGYGPNAQAPAPNAGVPDSADPQLLNVLDGVPPAGSTALQVSGGDAQAWIQGDHMFIRTRYAILSPGWLATMSSADGMKAYEMPKSPLLLVSANGKIIQLKIEGL